MMGAVRRLALPLASSYDGAMRVSHRKAAAGDPDSAAYTLAEAARCLRLPAATLRSWYWGVRTRGPTAAVNVLR
jgi:hypothetical protein